MNEVLFYSGIFFVVVFLMFIIYLFFKNNIVSVVQYCLKNKRKTNRIPYRVEETQTINVAHNYATALIDADTTILLPSLNE